MSNGTKLLVSAITLSIVLVIAAIAQRNQKNSLPGASVLARAEGTRERKVFGEQSPPPLVVPAPVTAVPETVERENPNVPADILGFLERWRSSMASGDIDTHVNTYAPRLGKFFRQRRVSRDFVRQEKERMRRIYPEVYRYDIKDVRVESQRGDRAVLTLTKDWDTSGVRRFAGSERQRLTLQKMNGQWRITDEEELKVFWVRR